MSTVILAEKPSQALAYASALKQSTKKDGYFEIKDPLFTERFTKTKIYLRIGPPTFIVMEHMQTKIAHILKGILKII